MLTSYLALDVGKVRIGLATGNTIARLASPLKTINNDADVRHTLLAIIAEESIDELVIGLPRGLNGQETEQTTYVREFIIQLQSLIVIPLHFQDEALTSVKAEQELKQRGKPFQKGDIDVLSAVYILEDFFKEGVH